ncbi:MAG: TerB family tellurite resistance protein [Bacteroidota bacterium]
MLSVENQISILAHLSKADKVVAEEEYELMLFIAKRLGLSAEEAIKIVGDPGPIPDLKALPNDEKFEYLHNVISLMKADGKVHKNEVAFCEKLAIKLGYKPGVISQLSAYIFKDPSITTDWDHLRAIADKNMVVQNAE